MVANKRVIDGWHDEVCDTTAGITEARGKGVGGANNTLVEEAGRPHLARDERSTENTDEKTESQQARSIVDGTSQKGRNSSSK